MNQVIAGKPVRPVPRRGRLLAVLGVVFGLAVTVGNTIGSGILRTPGEVAARLPSPVLFLAVWVLGGVYALLGANALAELAALTAESGGYTVFVRRALGPFLGFAVGWSDWLSTCTSMAAAAFVISEYSAILIPALAPAVKLIACATVLFFTALQWRGVRVASRTQNVTTALKALAFIALVVACFMFGGRAATHVAAATTFAVPAGVPLLVAFILSMQSVIFTYDGFAGITYFAGEVRNPARDIPRSIFGGVLSVIAIYLLVNIAFLYVLPISAMAGQTLVAGTAAQAIFGARGDSVIRALTIVSLLSSINAFQLIASRIFYGVSATGLMPAGALVNEGGTPTLALLVSSIAAVVFILSGSFDKVIAVTAFFFVANYTLSFLSVFALRRREPTAPRPFHAWGHPWTTAVVLTGSIAFMVATLATDTRNTFYSIGLLALSYPLFKALEQRRRPPTQAQA
jgi:basic amino acid/polyamine antiporter, APA family